jgi:hypothetical protein
MQVVRFAPYAPPCRRHPRAAKDRQASSGVVATKSTGTSRGNTRAAKL